MARLSEVLKTMSYSEIARRTGTTPGYISLLFRGKRSTKLETLGKLSKALGVGVEELHGYLTRISYRNPSGKSRKPSDTPRRRKRSTAPVAA